MRFNLSEIESEHLPRKPEVGDVFIAKGGAQTALWVMVAETQSGASGHYLGLDEHGQIVSTSSYSHHAITTRRLVGRVNLEELSITVQPTCAP